MGRGGDAALVPGGTPLMGLSVLLLVEALRVESIGGCRYSRDESDGNN